MKIHINNLTKYIGAVTIISGLLLYSSCEKDQGPLIVTPAAPPQVSFSSVIQPIFTSNCISCHGSSSPQGKLDLTAGSAWSNLVNVPSAGYSSTLRVDPGSAANSVLYIKVTHTGDGGLMPPAGALPANDITEIQQWINQGALKN